MGTAGFLFDTGVDDQRVMFTCRDCGTRSDGGPVGNPGLLSRMREHLRSNHRQREEQLTSYENRETGVYRFGGSPDVAAARHSDSPTIGGEIWCHRCKSAWSIAPHLDVARVEIAVIEHLRGAHGFNDAPSLETYVGRDGDLAIWIRDQMEDNGMEAVDARLEAFERDHADHDVKVTTPADRAYSWLDYTCHTCQKAYRVFTTETPRE